MATRSALLAGLAAALLLAGCGGVRVTAENAMPRPLVDELPLKAGLYYSAEFRNYTASEERFKTKWQVLLGPAHVAAIERLAKAMFASVAPVSDLAKLPSPPLDVVLEPRFEEYSFLTPRDAGAELYAVTIKYRINVYDGAGHLIDSLVLTGFGNEPAGSLSSSKPLAIATRKAMRDAGAKFAAEFPDQPVVKKLVRHEPITPLAQGGAPAEGTITEVSPAAVKPSPPVAAKAPASAPAAPAAAATATPQAPAPAASAPPAPAAPGAASSSEAPAAAAPATAAPASGAATPAEPANGAVPGSPNAAAAEAPKADAPKADAPKTDAPTTDAPKSDVPAQPPPSTVVPESPGAPSATQPAQEPPKPPRSDSRG
jgi:hypothetical protein